MKHFGDNSSPNPLDRFMADEDSMTVHDSDEKPDFSIPEDKESKKTAGTWEADVIPE